MYSNNFVSLQVLKLQFSKMADAGNIEAPESPRLLLLLQNILNIFAFIVIQNHFIFKQKYRIFKGFFEIFKIFLWYLETFLRSGKIFGRFYVFSWKGLSTEFFMPVFMLLFYTNLSIKTQARLEDVETSFKEGKDLRPASSHLTSRYPFCTCSRSLFDWLRKPTEGGREKTLGTRLTPKFGCDKVVSWIE